MSTTTILFQNQTTNATSEELGWPAEGEGWIQVEGTPDGAIVTVEVLMTSGSVNASGNFLALSPLTFTDTEVEPTPFRTPRGRFRAVISNEGASTDLTVVVQT